jgi:hypothetical protein
MNDFQPQRGCAIFALKKATLTGATALRLGNRRRSFPRVAAQRGNPGLEVEPLWGKGNLMEVSR